MTVPQFGSFGWSDDIAAVPQEFDTITALDQEEWIHAELQKQSGVTRENYLEHYRKARQLYRQERSFKGADDDRMDMLFEAVSIFGAQASARARQGTTGRCLVSFSSPDQLGIVAAAARAMAGAGGNVEGAFMSVVAEQLLMTFLLSGIGNDDTDELQEILTTSLDPPHVKPAIVLMEADEIDWPRPGSTFWHLTARLYDGADLVIPITEEIAARELPVMALSTWVEEPSRIGGRAQVVDLNFAVKPRGHGETADLLGELRQGIRDRVPKAQVGLRPVVWPTRGRSRGDVVAATPNDFILVVLGHAQPGFVCSVLKASRGAFGEVFETTVALSGSTMAIMEGITVLTMVLSPEKPFIGMQAEAMERRLEDIMETALKTDGHDRPVVRLRILDEENWPSRPSDANAAGRSNGDSAEPGGQARPTHELRLQVPEQRWVLAKVATVLTKHGVNINWLVSYVLEPLVGAAWPRCALEMHIHVPENVVEKVDADLRSLTDAEDWGAVSLRPWSLSADTEK